MVFQHPLPALLELIGRSGAERAVGPVMHNLESFSRANPHLDCPDHARALRALTKQKLDDRCESWLAWWRNRN